jgi:hypothetical protein
MSEAWWYSERMTPKGTWSPQITPERPQERTADGRKVTLRRVRELAPDEVADDLAALQAREDAREAKAFALALDEAQTARAARFAGVRG